MGNFLDTPLTDKCTELKKNSENLPIGITGMQGWRTEMEVRFL